MSTTRMQAPSGYEYAVVNTEFGNVPVNTSGQVDVDSRCVAALQRLGFTTVGVFRTAGGQRTATSGEGAANTLDIATGLDTISSAIVQVIRAGKVATSDAAVSWTGGTITVANGSTFDLATGDVINWIAVGVDSL